MKFSVCIDAVFKGEQPVDALEKLQKVGFNAYEFWGWWDKDLDAIKQKADSLSISCVALCTKFIPLTDSGRREEYLQGLEETILVAKKMGCKTIISQIGNDIGISRERQYVSVVEGLKEAASTLRDNDCLMVIEPLNGRVNHKGTYLESSDEGFQILDEVGSENVKMLFDIYHQQITEGDIIRRISDNIKNIGHFHAAGNPGRHEFYNGEINYKAVMEVVESLGYQNYFGLEYFPLNDPIQGLEKIQNYIKENLQGGQE